MRTRRQQLPANLVHLLIRKRLVRAPCKSADLLHESSNEPDRLPLLLRHDDLRSLSRRLTLPSAGAVKSSGATAEEKQRSTCALPTEQFRANSPIPPLQAAATKRIIEHRKALKRTCLGRHRDRTPEMPKNAHQRDAQACLAMRYRAASYGNVGPFRNRPRGHELAREGLVEPGGIEPPTS